MVAQPDKELDADGRGDRMRVTRQVRRNLRCHLGQMLDGFVLDFLVLRLLFNLVVFFVF